MRALFYPPFSRRSWLCLAYRPRKPPKFGPNVSPNANGPMLPSRSSASRSIACCRPGYQWKRKLAAKPQATAFLRVQTSDSTVLPVLKVEFPLIWLTRNMGQTPRDQESQKNWPDKRKTSGKQGFSSGEERIRTTNKFPRRNRNSKTRPRKIRLAPQNTPCAAACMLALRLSLGN